MWKPIETAPRDGTEFQAWIITDDADNGYWEPKVRFNPENECVQFWGRVEYDWDGWDYYPWVMPTYWMPLPEQPEQVSNGITASETAAK